jgi:hypothetical protein
MNIVALTGAIGHGKTTFADALTELVPNSLHIETGVIVAETLEALHANIPPNIQPSSISWMNQWLKTWPPVIEHLLNTECDYGQLAFTDHDKSEKPDDFKSLFGHVAKLATNPALMTEHITADNKANHRLGLQAVGGYLVSRVSHTIWYDEIFRRLGEAEESGATLAVIGGVRYPSDAAISRANGAVIVEVNRPGMPDTDTDDPTERERKLIVPDVLIVNNGSIAELHLTAAEFLIDLGNNQLKQQYSHTA